MQTFLDAIPMTKEKMIAAWQRRVPKPDRSTRHQLSDRVPARKPCPRVDDSECDDQHTFALSYADPRSAAAFERAALAPSSSGAAPRGECR